jgi:hypothetical protein
VDFLALAAALAQPADDLIAGIPAVGHHTEQFVGALLAKVLRWERQLRFVAER